jgi:DNA polymerase-3 subunit delta
LSALKQAGEIAAFLRAPPKDVRFVLIYGPDDGLVAERAAELARALLGDTPDPFALVRLDGDAVATDPPRLADELLTVPLFGGKRLVRLHVAGKSAPTVAATLGALLAGPSPDTPLIVEAGDLKGASPLRKLFEASRSAIALPCYADDEGALLRLVEEELGAAGLKASPEVKRLVAAQLGGDRLASRQELRKLALYVHGRGEVTEDDVLAACGDVSAPAIDHVVDAAMTGDAASAASALRRLLGEGVPASVIGGAALRHLMQTQAARAQVDAGKAVGEALREFRPPVFYKRQPKVERQLVLWTTAKAQSGAAALQGALLASRQHAELGGAAIERALLAIAALARRRQP